MRIPDDFSIDSTSVQELRAELGKFSFLGIVPGRGSTSSYLHTPLWTGLGTGAILERNRIRYTLGKSEVPDFSVPPFGIGIREGSFFPQDNTYDCGPCSILNLISALGVSIPECDFSITGIKNKANELRLENGRIELRPHEWFELDDIREVLRQIPNYICKTAVKREEKALAPQHLLSFEEVESKITTGELVGVIACINDNHFVTYIPLPSYQGKPRTIILNSLNKSGPEISNKIYSDFIREWSTRYERAYDKAFLVVSKL